MKKKNNICKLNLVAYETWILLVKILKKHENDGENE